jgi:hypothetical protein
MLMFVILLLGTFYQIDNGIYDAQKKYFDAKIVKHEWGPIVIPLPGAYLIMTLFAVNLTMGGLIRMKKRLGNIGILITHIGMAVMVISGAMTFHFADRGSMQLYETQTGDEFQSYHEWNVEIVKVGSDDAPFIIPDEEFMDLIGKKDRTFHSDSIPFEVALHGYLRNCNALPDIPNKPANVQMVDGYYLHPFPKDTEAERNAPGVYATIVPKDGEPIDAILFSYEREPFTVQMGDDTWTVGLARKRWKVPFTITLDNFEYEYYAGTQDAKKYESYVTKTENGADDSIKIWMNHPLRYKGYTFFQTSWGINDRLPGNPVFSVFSVVRNPGDQGPLYACIIIGCGLSIHFIKKLLEYMKAEAKRRTT